MEGLDRLEQVGIAIPPTVRAKFDQRDQRVAKIDAQQYETGKRNELVRAEDDALLKCARI